MNKNKSAKICAICGDKIYLPLIPLITAEKNKTLSIL